MQSVFKYSDVLFALKSDRPQWRHLVAKSGTQLGPVDRSSDVPPTKSGTTSGQFDIWSAFGSG